MFGALLGAGASLIGGLFGGSKKKQETTTTSHVDYGRMVREAEAAGFNPLTALRNGGAAGFSVSTGTTPATPLSERLVNGVTGAAQSFLTNFDPFVDQQRDIGFRVAEAQLANLQADTRLKHVQLGGVPSYTAGTQSRKMGSGVKQGQTYKSVADALPASAGAPQTPSIEQPTLTNPYSVMSGTHINPNVYDASNFEERYGDDGPPSWINNTSVWTSDGAYNFERNMQDLYASRPDMIKRANGRVGWEIGRDVIAELWKNLSQTDFRKNPPLLSPRKK